MSKIRKSTGSGYRAAHRQFGTAGLILSIIALVFALGGGAYAAVHHNKAKVVKGPRGPKGATGPAGPAGPQGPAGTNGTNGTNGTDGTDGTDGSNGTNGKSVLNGSGAPADGTGTNGDFYIDTAANQIYGPKASGTWTGTGPTDLQGQQGDPGDPGDPGASVTGTPIPAGDACGTGTTGVKYSLSGNDTNVCNGSPWTAGGTLPIGATETGVYAAGQTSLNPASSLSSAYAPISFPIPLSTKLAAAKIIYNPATGSLDPTHCPGIATHPQAASGYLCIYESAIANVATFWNTTTGAVSGASLIHAGTSGFDAGIAIIGRAKTTTGNLDGSATVSSVADTTAFNVGDGIYDRTNPSYIPSGTTVTAIDSVNGTLTLSNAAAGTATGDTLVNTEPTGLFGSWAVTG